MPDVVYEQRGPIAWITIDRPPMNPLRAQTWDELEAATARAAADTGARVVVFTGRGDRAFCVGADLKELRESNPDDGLSGSRRLQRLMNGIERMPKPTVAAVNGYAMGGGFELAGACTFRVASENARFGVAEVDVGFVPSLGSCQRLVRLIGYARALDLVLTSRLVDAQEAYQIGLVHRLAPSAELMKAAEELASTLAAKPPTVLTLTMEAMRLGHEMSSDASDVLTAALHAATAHTSESLEARRRLRERTVGSRRGE